MTQITTLADIKQTILDAICTCLEENSPLGRPEFCFTYHNEPPADCCDYVSVWAERLRPSNGFADGQYVTGGRLVMRCGLATIADLNIRLMRPCFPVLIDNPRDPFPEPDVMQQASELLDQDAWIMNCCFQQMVTEGLLEAVGECLEVGIGDMVPIGPQGGCAGWNWDISVEMPVCC